MFLAGDLGGTKTILAEFEPTDDGVKTVRESKFASRSYPTFSAMLAEFLASRTGRPLKSACFGVAGTVVNGVCHTTNLPWALDDRVLAGTIGVARVKLLNDLEATAYGVLTLPASDLAVLNPGASPSPSRAGNVAVVAAGTGLGEALLYWDGTHYHPIASEGGHADFAPTTERQIELWRFLRGQAGDHVSGEKVLSGPGFLNIYHFLRDEKGHDEPSWLAEEIRSGSANAVISAHGLAGDVPLCVETVTLFASIYGAEAGNAALRYLATGGVFLAGGIAPKLLPMLRSGAFLDAFARKGRFHDFLAGLEVSVSLNPKAALQGAAHYALRL